MVQTLLLGLAVDLPLDLAFPQVGLVLPAPHTSWGWHTQPALADEDEGYRLSPALSDNWILQEARFFRRELASSHPLLP